MDTTRRLASVPGRASLLCLAGAVLIAACGHPADRLASEAPSAAADALNGAGVKNPVDAQLFRAVAANDAAAAAALIEQDADVNALDVLGRTPLYTAAFYKRPDLGKLLLAHGAKTDIRDTTGLTPLHTAVISGNIGLAAALIDAGADINARSDSGKTPLHLAAATGQPELARLLIIDGADKSVKDNHGETAAALAEENHHPVTATLIRKPDAKP
jgi:ankyrin repeat protein